MFGRKKYQPEPTPEIRYSALDRILVDKTGQTEKFGISPFGFILREAVVEYALSTDPQWPPENPYDAIRIYNDYQTQYDTGVLDSIVAELDLNSIVSEAGRLATASVGGVFPRRRKSHVPLAVNMHPVGRA